MLLDQADDLAARVDAVTALLDEAIAAVPAAPAITTTVDVATGELASATSSYPSGRADCAVPRAAETARAVIGEIGLDMAVFGTAPRLCSWAKARRGRCSRAG